LLKNIENELVIRKVLKALMKEHGETLASISKATGVPKSTLSEWLSNRSPNPVQAVSGESFRGESSLFVIR
jgi:predicted transcriptional regulator